MIDPSQDAFGAALLDYLEGKQVPELVLEVDGGQPGPRLISTHPKPSDGVAAPVSAHRVLALSNWWPSRPREIDPLQGGGGS